jgi:hypothetical protein
MYQTKSPVLFLIFNRPDTTLQVFEQIRLAKPSKLYVAADGFRSEKIEEEALCKETRSILNQIDWDCDVKTLFRDKNLGCKYAVSSAIDWFFENEEQGIILEDDCLPHNDFFQFCDKLLEKYQNDHRIMHIGGTNFHSNVQWGAATYYFSNLVNVWGWASWRRAWQKYNVELQDYTAIDSFENFNKIFGHKLIANCWATIFQRLIDKKINTWDYQWTITVMLNNGLSIMPNLNLIQNIGFGENATHTKNSKEINSVSNLKTFPISKWSHPIVILPEKKADLITMYREFRIKKLKRKNLFRKIKFWKKYEK